MFDTKNKWLRGFNLVFFWCIFAFTCVSAFGYLWAISLGVSVFIPVPLYKLLDCYDWLDSSDSLVFFDFVEDVENILLSKAL